MHENTPATPANSIQVLFQHTLVRVAAYYIFFDRNENNAVRDRNTVCLIDCACQLLMKYLTKNLSVDKVAINPRMPLQRL